MPERLALWFMFFAYSAVFLILFGLVGRTYREARAMREEITRLRQEFEETASREDG